MHLATKQDTKRSHKDDDLQPEVEIEDLTSYKQQRLDKG